MKRLKRYIVLTFSLLTIAILGVGLLLRNQSTVVRGQSQSSTGAASQNADPFNELNRKARAAKSGEPNSVQALADEVFAATAVFPEIPPEAVDAMKDRLVRAEMEYRGGNGKQKSIEEIDVARMVNQLADALSLPDYAKTCPLQVRHLRMSLLLYLPNIIGQEHFKEKPGAKRKVGSIMSGKMSPLEAAYVALVLLEQKKDNAAFQVTSEEWRALVYKKKLDLWQAHREGKNVELGTAPILSNQSHDNPRRDEIAKAAAKAIEALPIRDLQNIPNRLLDTLLSNGKEEQR